LPSVNQFLFTPGSQYAIPSAQEQFQITQFGGLNSYQYPMQFPTYTAQNMAMSQVGSLGQGIYQY
jgi:hypothetical protein